jgi:peptidoglycan-associated lipoprotein
LYVGFTYAKTQHADNVIFKINYMKMKMKAIALFFALITLTTYSVAQNKYLKDARKAYVSENYCESIDKCTVAYKKITRKGRAALKAKGEMAFMIAESYRQVENFKEAHEWYESCILLKYYKVEPLVYFNNGEMLREMAEWKKATEQFQSYKSLVPGDDMADIKMKSCEEFEKYVEERTRHTVANTSLSKEGFDMAPALIDRKGTMMAFGTSSSYPEIVGDKDPRTCEKYMDIFVSEIDRKGNFTQPVPIKGEGINTEDNEGTLCVDGRGKTMFFTRCPNVKKQNMGCEIWMAEKGSKDEWVKPVKLSLKSNDSISVGHPCVTEDGKFLIFASDLPGGLGGKDLWYTSYDKKSDSWASPTNMGSGINTTGDELFPSFGLKNELIYASNGMPGMGGLDMFYASRVGEGNKWENPQNFGSPINSEFNDYAMQQTTERKGYFTSERKGSVNTSETWKPDIWSYELPPFLYSLKINVTDKSDKSGKTKIAGAKINVTGSDNSKWEGVTNKDGSIFWDKKASGDRYVNEEVTYKMKVGKEKFYEDTLGAKITTIELNQSQDFVVDMGLYPIKPIRLPEVRYIFGKWDFVVDSTINSKDSLLFVLTMLDENPGMVLELSSHTDPRGNNEMNRILSDNRAKACYRFLVDEKGVDPKRIVPVGKGELEPRKMYLYNGQYLERQPMVDEKSVGEEVVLTETYINQFKADKKKFEMLMQYNRRTEAKIVTLTYDPKVTPEPSPEVRIFRDIKTGKPLAAATTQVGAQVIPK